VMPQRIFDRRHVTGLVDAGAQLVDVLPAEEYQSEHIAGAQHLWLRELDAKAGTRLDASRPVIVYCNDFL
jgi:rhodanese-related sulfurtransferase